MVVWPPVRITAPAGPQLVVEDGVPDEWPTGQVEQKLTEGGRGSASEGVTTATGAPIVYRHVGPSTPWMADVSVGCDPRKAIESKLNCAPDGGRPVVSSRARSPGMGGVFTH